MHVAEIRAGLDLAAVLAQHAPKVIVDDVVAPYDRNWRSCNTCGKRCSRTGSSC
jgi:hypothetical protein